MKFDHTYKMVLARKKDTTRRFVYPNDKPVYDSNGRITAVESEYNGLAYVRFKVGDERDIETRKRINVGSIRILEINQDEDVRQINEVELQREGGMNIYEFLLLWAAMYDKDAIKDHHISTEGIRKIVRRRPDHLYKAWVVRFELVSENNLF